MTPLILWRSINRATHRDQVLLHKRSEHVVSYGGHNVTEVQGGDDAILPLVLLGERLARVFQLQLLKNTTWHHKAECKNSRVKDIKIWRLWRALPAYLQELGELQIVEVFLVVVAKVQADELTVPVEGNMVVHCGLAEDVPHILCSTNEQIIITRERKKRKRNSQIIRELSVCDVRRKAGIGSQKQALLCRDYVNPCMCNALAGLIWLTIS